MSWRPSAGIAAGIAIAGAVAGCGAEEEPPPTGPPWVEVGTGLESFGPLTDGQSLQIVRGIQGGHMVPLSLRAGGLVPGDDGDPDDARNPQVAYRLVLGATGAEVGTASRQLGLTRAGDAYELVGTWTLFDPSLPTEDYFDQDVRIELDIADTRGVTAADSVVVRALAPQE